MTTPTAPAAAETTALGLTATAFYTLLAALSERTATAALTVWRDLAPQALSASWADTRAADRLMVLVGSGQLAAARHADSYVRQAVTAQDATPDPAGALVPDVFAGIASDGRDLDDLLLQPLISTAADVAAGADPAEALRTNEQALATIAATQVSDAGRAAVDVAMTAEPAVTGYVRMLTPPSCGRCAVLAGRRYRVSSGFQRHPNCFPAGTVVSGPGASAAARRWFEGELVILTTASGQHLSVTGNHPVLTRRGWRPARLLNEGDEVVRGTRSQGAAALEVPHHDQVPALIEDVWRALRVDGLTRMPAAAEYFHGDGQGGDVDVVGPNRALLNVLQPAFGEPLRQSRLAAGDPALSPLVVKGAPLFRQRRNSIVMLGRGKPFGVGADRLAPSRTSVVDTTDRGGLLGAATVHSSVGQSLGDHTAADAVLMGERQFAGAVTVGGHDAVGGHVTPPTRWNAPGDAFTMETADGYTRRGSQLLERLTGQVELDRVVELRRVDWAGHVYSLTSVEGWHTANGLIVSNCDCVHIPAVENAADDLRTDPDDYFRSLSRADQDRYFTKAGAEAIRLGADIGQVVNARRGAAGLSQPGRLTTAEQDMVRGGRRGRLQKVDVYGRQLEVTSEGTTRRGVAGARLIAESGTARSRTSNYRRAKTPRLMPSAIAEIAGGDRDEQLRLLRRFGYVA